MCAFVIGVVRVCLAWCVCVWPGACKCVCSVCVAWCLCAFVWCGVLRFCFGEGEEVVVWRVTSDEVRLRAHWCR